MAQRTCLSSERSQSWAQSPRFSQLLTEEYRAFFQTTLTSVKAVQAEPFRSALPTLWAVTRVLPGAPGAMWKPWP